MGYIICRILGNKNLRFVKYYNDVIEASADVQNQNLDGLYGIQADRLSDIFPNAKEEARKSLKDLLIMSETEIAKKYTKKEVQEMASKLGITLRNESGKLYTEKELIKLIIEKLTSDGDNDNSKRKK